MEQALTVFFADIANSTKMYQNIGDTRAHKIITDCLKRLKTIIENNRGTLLRTVGDATLAVFDKPDDACNAAMEAQIFYTSSEISLRIGFHDGDVIPDSGDIYGNDVNLAARIASFANENEIYTTQNTANKLSYPAIEKAEYVDHIEFKGIAEPLPISRIIWNEKIQYTRIIPSSGIADLPEMSSGTLQLKYNSSTSIVDSQHTNITVGRSEANTIVINNDTTSTSHLIIEFRSNQFFLTDTSTNGSYIVPNNENMIFIRRESTRLHGEGVICTGWNPDTINLQPLGYLIL